MTRRLIRNVMLDGRVVDLAIEHGLIAEVAAGLRGEELFDARGASGLPGLHDHHIHLLATAAQRQSVQLDGCGDLADVAQALRVGAARLAPGDWLRATGYHERMAGLPDARGLDEIVADRPVRVQHQTGGLWLLNSAALARLGGGGWPQSAERSGDGTPTGRFYRCDAWLSDRIGRTVPDLGELGRALAARGVTGVTDASVSTDAASAALLAEAVRDGRLPLRLTLMSGGPLAAPADGAFAVGPLKLLLDDHVLPAPDEIAARIGEARRQGRTVAVHCVTAGELAITLAGFADAGSVAGDRIEHGSVIPAEAIGVIRELGLTVVTQSGFIATRGERYRALVDAAEQPDLYRCASLIAASVPVGGSSDAPYGDLDPWAGIRAAITRRTTGGHVLGGAEAISAPRALALYLTAPDAPGGAPRRICAGAAADLCLIDGPVEAALAAPAGPAVVATVVGGAVSYRG